MTDISVGSANKYGISIGTKVKVKVAENTQENKSSDTVSKYTQLQLEDKVTDTKTTPKGMVPKTPDNISESFNPSNKIVVGDRTFTNIKPITKGLELEDVKKITSDNQVDEVFFKSEDGQLYMAYGEKENKGSLDIGALKENYIGKYGDKAVKLVHIDNEINTVKEGALSPLTSTLKNVKEAGSSGITKGVTEMGTTLVAIFVGKTVIENGITAVTTSKTAIGGISKGINIIDTGSKIVGNAGKTGKVIAVTVGSGLQKLAVGGLIAGAVVGTIVGSMSIYGALKARNPKNDYTTIDMVTNPSLSFNPKNNP